MVALMPGIVCSRTAKCPDVSRTAPTDLSDFGKAFPIGNGHLGGKIFGHPCLEIIPVNEATLWSGVPRDYNDPSQAPRIAGIRSALYDGDYALAQRLAEGLSAHDNEAYQPLGDVVLRMLHGTDVKDYVQTLSMSRATVTVRYSVDGVVYTREIFASHADNAIVMRITADRRRAVDMVLGLRSALPHTCEVDGATVRMSGRAPSHVDNYDNKGIVEWEAGGGMGFDAVAGIRQRGGRTGRSGDSLVVTGADEVCVLFTAATQYDGAAADPRLTGERSRHLAESRMRDVLGKEYAVLRRRHAQDYEPLFSRVSVEIGGRSDDPYALAYQWARYCLLACSREDSRVPRNEQGIWNRDLLPRYASNYTLNENPQKYYVLAEAANLAECVEPLVRFTSELAANGAVTARTEYGFDGWVAHHNSDVWAKTTLATGRPCWALWPMGGVWLVMHAWERYRFGTDKGYLAERAYPLMKGAARFCLDLLMENRDGFLVTAPSTSPENSFLGSGGERLSVDAGTTADMALVRELFEACMAACDTLGTDGALRDSLERAYGRLLPYRIGPRGELAEYSHDAEEFEPHHRHASHCIAVWPLGQISRDRNPHLLPAVRRSLELREGGGYHPDKAGMLARLGEGDKCLEVLDPVFPKLYDTPFGGFAEMILQSHAEYIDVLPALPSKWKSGRVSGLCARGGLVLDIGWEEGELTSLTIRTRGAEVPERIRVKGRLLETAKDRRIRIVRAKD